MVMTQCLHDEMRSLTSKPNPSLPSFQSYRQSLGKEVQSRKQTKATGAWSGPHARHELIDRKWKT